MRKSALLTIGSNYLSDTERERHDYYAVAAVACLREAEALLAKEDMRGARRCVARGGRWTRKLLRLHRQAWGQYADERLTKGRQSMLLRHIANAIKLTKQNDAEFHRDGFFSRLIGYIGARIENAETLVEETYSPEPAAETSTQVGL